MTEAERQELREENRRLEQLVEIRKQLTLPESDTLSSVRVMGCIAALLTERDALAEQVEALTRERDEARDGEARWLGRVHAIRYASGLGAKPMLDELPGAIGDLISSQAAEIERLMSALSQGQPQ